MTAWIVFILSGLVVVAAGVRLTRNGDVIAERTGLGAAWVGMVFVAIATSLPELATDIFAIRQGDIDLAVGDLFGSSMANMLILALADLYLWRQHVLMRVAVNQALVGALAIAMTLIAVAGILANDGPTVFGIGWAPILIAGSYIAGIRLLHLNRDEPPFEESEEAVEHLVDAEQTSLRRAVTEFGIAAVVILIAAPFLARSAGDIAEELGVATGVVGVALLAVTTSLPELTVTFVSMRDGAYDMAVGNLLGSNCINMVLFLILDVVEGPGSLLTQAGPSALMAGVFATILMAQTIFEVLNTSEERIRWLEPDAALRVATYVLGLYLVVQAGT